MDARWPRVPNGERGACCFRAVWKIRVQHINKHWLFPMSWHADRAELQKWKICPSSGRFCLTRLRTGGESIVFLLAIPPFSVSENETSKGCFSQRVCVSVCVCECQQLSSRALTTCSKMSGHRSAICCRTWLAYSWSSAPSLSHSANSASN